jgi:acetyl-CoA C-acetyltransferase
MANDALTCAFDGCAMGESTERANDRYGVSREDQDAFSARSHQRAAAAMESGVFDEEITAVAVPQRKGDPVLVTKDEGVRPDTTAEVLGGLKASFVNGGTITAGNASPISDGACAVVVMSRSRAEELGLDWLAEIGAHGVVAGPDASLQEQPSNAIKVACKKEGISPSDLDVIEINEAFAAVGIASVRALDVDADRVNVNGGAIALGHPLGCSGARILTTLLHEMHRRTAAGESMRYGLATLCVGVGQGEATVIELEK